MKVRPALRLAAPWLACLLLRSNDAAAHGRSISYSSWSVEGMTVQVTVQLSELDLSSFPWAALPLQSRELRLAEYLVSHLRLAAAGQPCSVQSRPLRVGAGRGWRAYRWRLLCSSRENLHIHSDLFLERLPSHLHFVRVQRAGSPIVERVLSGSERSWLLGPISSSTGQRGGTTLLEYVGLGIFHILSGYDHLAFVLALLLLAGSIREVATLVTGFTIGHSLTLGLAVAGIVRPEQQAIEALIGYSVALVALENSWLLAGRPVLLPLLAVAGLLALVVPAAPVLPALALVGLALFTACHFGLLAAARRPEQLRVAVALAFGLVHGFGFAGVLAEMKLPLGRLAPALFGFNAGVEVGQLGAVLLAWPLLRLTAGRGEGRLGQWIAELGSAAVCGLGLFWFLTRALR